MVSNDPFVAQLKVLRSNQTTDVLYARILEQLSREAELDCAIFESSAVPRTSIRKC